MFRLSDNDHSHKDGDVLMKKNLAVGVLLVAAITMVFGSVQAEAQSAEDNPAEVEAGATVFAANCAGCHGDDGMGSSVGRSLIDIAEQGERSRHFLSVSGGRGGMPAWGEQLSVEEIDAALSYVRLTFVSEPAATQEEATPELLAETGVESPLVAVAGVTLFAAGALFVRTARRNE